MKQTAVDFIVKELDILHRERKEKVIDAETFFKHKGVLIKEAKEMEKQQTKYQAERMYSEEDVMNALHSVELKYNRDFSKIYEGVKEWFEQFKKKQHEKRKKNINICVHCHLCNDVFNINKIK